MEDADADYKHAKKKFVKTLKKKFQVNIMICISKVIYYFELLLSKIFRKMCLKNYHLDPVKFLSASVLAWKAALKITKVKLELLTDVDNAINGIKGIRGKYVTLSIYMQKVIQIHERL